jgi:hypothetical protein
MLNIIKYDLRRCQAMSRPKCLVVQNIEQIFGIWAHILTGERELARMCTTWYDMAGSVYERR